MDAYLWDAYQDDGSVIERWNLDGTENHPGGWYTRRFHLYTLHKPGLWISIPRGAQFCFGKRRHLGEELGFWGGYRMPDDEGSGGFWFAMTLEGEVRLANDQYDLLAYERQASLD